MGDLMGERQGTEHVTQVTTEMGLFTGLIQSRMFHLKNN